MNVTGISEKIVKLYQGMVESETGLAPLFLGAPGIGKSECVRDAAKKLAKKLGKIYIEYTDQNAEEILKDPDKYFLLVDKRLTECEPSDLGGQE